MRSLYLPNQPTNHPKPPSQMRRRQTPPPLPLPLPLIHHTRLTPTHTLLKQPPRNPLRQRKHPRTNRRAIPPVLPLPPTLRYVLDKIP